MDLSSLLPRAALLETPQCWTFGQVSSSWCSFRMLYCREEDGCTWRNRANGFRLGDTWILELSVDFTSGTWHMVDSQQSPPQRSGHTLTCIRENQVVLFEGRGLGYDVLDDVWILDIQEQCEERWVQIFYDFREVPQYASLPRIGHSATLVLGGRILIYGGEDSYRHRKDDFWVLDVKTIPSSGLQPQGVSLNGSSVWKKLTRISYGPTSRSFHRACADRSGRFVYVFGEMVDGLLQPAAWSKV